MKIIGIGHNYREHIKEMGGCVPPSPVVFLKPDTSILLRNRPFYIPEFSEEIDYEAELVIKISKNGKYIQEEYASQYYDEVALGVDFTARDLQKQMIAEGKPWTLCKGFDNSAPLSRFVKIDSLKDRDNILFRLALNDKIVQYGNSSDMVFPFEKLISFISRYISLKMGDIIFTGTPAGVGKVAIGDRVTGFIEDMQMMNFQIR
ncbi:MAG: fumarylacetoacetate hydrolase family protein [Bacteroidales bacterium]|nr:fumarylacetoacetate hydrolase family protein [Bacteroidales bacterium]